MTWSAGASLRFKRSMSALGHKRTFAVQNGMSALPPKADICSAQADVRFVPIADIRQPFETWFHRGSPARRVGHRMHTMV